MANNHNDCVSLQIFLDLAETKKKKITLLLIIGRMNINIYTNASYNPSKSWKFTNKINETSNFIQIPLLDMNSVSGVFIRYVKTNVLWRRKVRETLSSGNFTLFIHF